MFYTFFKIIWLDFILQAESALQDFIMTKETLKISIMKADETLTEQQKKDEGIKLLILKRSQYCYYCSAIPLGAIGFLGPHLQAQSGNLNFPKFTQ